MKKKKSLQISKITFYKIFFIIFEILVKSWEEVKGSYFDFPKIMSITSGKVEETLMTIRDKFALDRYLLDRLHLDISKEQAFRIYLPELSYKAILYDPTAVLGDVLKKLNIQRDLKNYVPYDLKGSPIINMEIPLSGLDIKGIYYYPKNQPPSPLRLPKTGFHFPFDTCTPPKRPFGRNATTNKTVSLPNLPPSSSLDCTLKIKDKGFFPPLPPLPLKDLPSRMVPPLDGYNLQEYPNEEEEEVVVPPKNVRDFKRLSVTSWSSPKLRLNEEVPMKEIPMMSRFKKKSRRQMEVKEPKIVKEKEKTTTTKKERVPGQMVRKISERILQEKNF